ncbi:Uncharacterised protein [uncultured archaeon]|nr:Uncharacterised protein [uncultured archaeon]
MIKSKDAIIDEFIASIISKINEQKEISDSYEFQMTGKLSDNNMKLVIEKLNKKIKKAGYKAERVIKAISGTNGGTDTVVWVKITWL